MRRHGSRRSTIATVGREPRRGFLGTARQGGAASGGGICLIHRFECTNGTWLRALDEYIHHCTAAIVVGCARKGSDTLCLSWQRVHQADICGSHIECCVSQEVNVLNRRAARVPGIMCKRVYCFQNLTNRIYYATNSTTLGQLLILSA